MNFLAMAVGQPDPGTELGRNTAARVLAPLDDPAALTPEQSIPIREDKDSKVMERLRHLVDVSSTKGVQQATEKGLVTNGVEYRVDCIMYASGFEITTEISRRYSIKAIEGRSELPLFDYSADGYKTLHGMTSRGIPNECFTGTRHGFIQVGISTNIAAPTTSCRVTTSPRSSPKPSRVAPRPSNPASMHSTNGAKPYGRPRLTSRRSTPLARQGVTTTKGAAVRGHPVAAGRAVWAEFARLRRAVGHMAR